MNYREADSIVCECITRFCEGLLDSGFTTEQMEFVDRALCEDDVLYDHIVEIVIQAKSAV